MRVRFWGTRGSLPTPLGGDAVRRKLRDALRAASGRSFPDDDAIDRFIDAELDFATRHTFGGNSACIEIVHGGDEYLLCDLGTGVRELGQSVLARHGPGAPQVFHVLLSHMHWDHIMGFPFFVPSYIPGNRVILYGCHENLEEALRRQHGPPSFPVSFDQLGADIEFVTLDPDAEHEIAGVSVRAKRQRHSGDSYGYRFEKDGRSVVYSTDAEHKLESESETAGFVDFFRDANVVIFDAMYSLAEAVSVKEDWGHSSNVVGVDLCHRARVEHYCMIHHEPIYDDRQIQAVLAETVRYEELMREEHALRISMAYDGLEIEV